MTLSGRVFSKTDTREREREQGKTVHSFRNWSTLTVSVASRITSIPVLETSLCSGFFVKMHEVKQHNQRASHDYCKLYILHGSSWTEV